MSDSSACESSTILTKATKRTRLCVSQSKHGCFTCKRRRIKCGEEKPACQRCVRSKVECEGYRERALPSRVGTGAKINGPPLPSIDHSLTSDKGLLASATHASPTYALLDRCSKSLTQYRLANVGVNLLRRGLCNQFEFTVHVFDGLLPQLSYALPSVNAAAAALGAIYELQSTASSTVQSDRRNAIAATQYGLAIKAMQQELQVQRFGSVPLLMICMLLACSELLLRRRGYCFMHIQAGFKLLEERRTSFSLTPTTFDARRSTSTSDTPLSHEDEIFLLFRTFDIHSSTYADRRVPSMPTTQVHFPSTILFHNINPHTVDLDLISAIHSCLYFTSNAAEYKYLSPSHVPSEFLVEQGRHLGILNAWLTRLDRYVLPKSITALSNIKPKARTHLLMLRNMCLSTIISASTILSPYETAWDNYSWYFEEIIRGAEEIMLERERVCSRSPTEFYSDTIDLMFTFTPLPGVIQPLCLTAFKYRHSAHRRRAAQLMRKAGREGPWIGELVAAVADRLIEVEEASISADLQLENLLWDDISLFDGANESASIPESARISEVGMDARDRSKRTNFSDPTSWTSRRSGETRARFSKCRDVEGMLEADLGVGPGSHSDDEDEDHQFPNERSPEWKNEKYWDNWNEVLYF